MMPVSVTALTSSFGPGVRAAGVWAPRVPRMSVEHITGYSEFLALEAPWNDLADRAGVAHPFLRHEWVRTWWDAFGRQARLQILVLRIDGQIAAIAPFMRDTAVMYGVPVRRLRLIHNDHTPRTDLIVAADAADAYRAIWRALRHDSEPWDVLLLGQLPHDSPARSAFSSFAAGDRCETGIWKSSDSPFLTLTGTWEQYLAGLPAKFRSNLRNRMTRASRLGEPTLEVLTDGSAIREACAEAWRLESSGWKEQTGTAIASDPEVHEFYTRLVERGAAAGWLQLLFLTVGGRRIATSYGASFRGRLFLFKTGYDPEYATCSPFKLLTYLAIQRAYAQGLREVDFLGDTEPWKREWTQASRGHDWLFIFADTLRARLLHAIKFQWVPEFKRWRA